MSQRTRLVTGAAMIWFLISSCAVETAGRAISAMNAITSSMVLWSAKNCAGDCASFIMSTRLPTKASSATSMTEPSSPATSRMANTGQIGRTKWR